MPTETEHCKRLKTTNWKRINRFENIYYKGRMEYIKIANQEIKVHEFETTVSVDSDKSLNVTKFNPKFAESRSE